MKKDKINEMIYILKNSTSWLSTSSISKMIGVSERTVRNYICECNMQTPNMIESSSYGYKIHSDTYDTYTKDTVKLDARSNLLLSKLLTHEDGISIYDIADELCISESTILNNVIPQLKKIVKAYDINLTAHDFTLYLTGEEHDKRKLIGHIVMHNDYGYFTSTETLKKLFPSFDIDLVLHGLFEICSNSKLLLNNYSMNNLLVHILIIIIRLNSKKTLVRMEMIDAYKLVDHFQQKEEILALANGISRFFSTTYNSDIPETDFQQIVILITLSIEHYSFDDLNFEQLSKFIDQTFLDNILSIADEMSERYAIPQLNNDFLLQFTLHMYNVYQRAIYNLSYPNPIANQIKKDYAPIYDMAVFFSHKFSVMYKIDLNEDEIAFIAFHIGAYLERNINKKEAISCIVIVENYHNFTHDLIKNIEINFAQDLTILDVMSYNQFIMQKPICDCILTTIDFHLEHEHKILINPILTKQNKMRIRNELEKIEEEKNFKLAKITLSKMLKPELYFRNLTLNTSNDYIEYMGNICLDQGLIDRKFIDDVILRESVSSTAFTECLAIPHAISQYAINSFICVLHNNIPIPWGRHNVKFILMIGVAQSDMKFFKDAFDSIIDIYSSVDKTVKILETDTFEKFKEVFIQEK